MADKENVMTLTYDLLLYIVPQLGKYPKTQKFLLGDRIQVELMDLLSGYIEAYYGERELRRGLLRQANLRLERLRYWIRLSKDLNALDLRRYELVSKKLEEIGMQTGAWLKSLGKA